MNFIRKTHLFEKLSYRSICKCSVIGTPPRTGRKSYLEGLFQTRIHKFLEQPENNHSKDLSKFDPEGMLNTNNSIPLSQEIHTDYNKLLTALTNYLNDKSNIGELNTLKKIDNYWCKFLGRFSKTEILSLLHLLMKTGHNVTTLNSYRSSILVLTKEASKGQLTNKEIVQLLFFVGLAKKLAKKKVKYLLNFLPPLKELSLMEQVAVSLSTFKADVKLKPTDARLLEEILERNSHELIKDPQILSTICKAVSLNRPTSNFSLANLSQAIIVNEPKFSVPSNAHILALCVRAMYHNADLIEKLFRDSMDIIEEQKTEATFVRIKDFDRIVWSLTWLNYTLKDSDKETASLFVNRRIREFKQMPYILMNTLFCLWVLDCRLQKILEECLNTGVFMRVKENTEQWKTAARLQLFLSYLKIESPEIKLPCELFQNEKLGMKISKSIKELYKKILSENNLDVEEIKIDCPVHGIYIPGISLTANNQLVHIDIFNKVTCFKDTIIPHGLTNLKLRLLKKMGYHSITIPEGTLIEDVFSLISKTTSKIDDKR